MHKKLSVLVLVCGMLAVFAAPAKAHKLVSGNVSLTCSGYSITFTSIDLTATDHYTISWTIDGLGATSINSSTSFTGVSGSYTNTVHESLTLNGSFAPSGTATFVDETIGVSNTVILSFSPTSMTCEAPPPPPCAQSATNSSNFNGTAVAAGDYIWFNANFKANNVPHTGVTILFTQGKISFTSGGVAYNLNVPNAQITFSTSATCTSTTFDSGTNTWKTTVPVTGDDEIFLTGLAWQIPAGGLAGGVNPVNFSGTYSSTTKAPGLSIEMKWGAAAYSKFTNNYNALAVKAGHQTACGPANGDHAGTPEGVDSTNTAWKRFVIGGARGGGGSNFTGSWSGTLNILICS